VKVVDEGSFARRCQPVLRPTLSGCTRLHRNAYECCGRLLLMLAGRGRRELVVERLIAARRAIPSEILRHASVLNPPPDARLSVEIQRPVRTFEQAIRGRTIEGNPRRCAEADRVFGCRNNRVGQTADRANDRNRTIA
jgi:hypothetical protein